MVHAIIVLPGTTGTDLFAAQVTNPVPPVAPPAPAAVWLGGVMQDATNNDVSGGTSAMEQDLFAGLPSGYSDKGGSATGYVALIQSIIAAAAAAKPSQTYEALYTSWPTNAPPVQSQAWLPGGVPTKNCVIGFGYDWRLDNLTVTAPALQNFLQYLTGPGSTVSQITLIGHSMGGLVSRAYLESVGTNDSKILGMIDQLITLGTPHLGAPMALAPISKTLEIVKGLSGEVFFYFLEEILNSPSPAAIKNLTAIIDAVVNSNPWGVSTYQLLPSATFITEGSANYSMASFANLPQGLQTLLTAAGFQQTNLNSANAFFGALKNNANPNPTIKYQCLYGVVGALHWSKNMPLVFDTTTGYTYTENPSALTAVRTDGGGDLVVPKESASFSGNNSPSVYRYEVAGADHLHMPSNPDIQAHVNKLLGFTS